ncbi:MAG: protease [candidate division WS1 bacterium]|nr:protease [candidate division WS1 bacterium]
MVRTRLWLLTPMALAIMASAPSAQGTLLLRDPGIGPDSVAFVYAGDIWLAPLSGGEARRLTSAAGDEWSPRISPDGEWVAFSGQYDGNTDVYVVPISGGEPRRLTYHPSGDGVRGWTPDGSRILFASARDGADPYPTTRLWTIAPNAEVDEPLPMMRAHTGSFSPRRDRMAYCPFSDAIGSWRGYRGGRTSLIWIIDMEDYSVEMIPRDNSNDLNPMWIGEDIYFLSDRAGTMNLFRYSPDGAIEQLTHFRDYDIKSASASKDAIVFEQAGALHVYDIAEGSQRRLEIDVRVDRGDTRPRWENAASMIRSYEISPKGARALFEARGDIFTVPGKKGDVRNLTESTGVHDRLPTWSPDGRMIAWFSDEGGEYHIKIGEQTGLEKPRQINLPEPSFYNSPQWSPDSKTLLYEDCHRRIWTLDVESEEATIVHFAPYGLTSGGVWSPDSKWIAYGENGPNGLSSVLLYNTETLTSTVITDGLAAAVSPAFDRNGKYLYLMASTDYGMHANAGMDMSSYERSISYQPYIVLLSDEEPSPWLLESDEEEIEEPEAPEEPGEPAEEPSGENGDETSGEAEEAEATAEEPAGEQGEGAEESPTDEEGEDLIDVDLEGINQRILPMRIPGDRDVDWMMQGPAEGTVFYFAGGALKKFTVESAESSTVLEGADNVALCADGSKLLYSSGGSWYIADAKGRINAGDGRLDLGGMTVQIDPRAEWSQMYGEAWRILREFFYDPTMHGEDWPAMYEKYRHFVEHVANRGDLTYLFQLLQGELVVGHAYQGGGDYFEGPPSVSVGMLGADYSIEDGRYRIKRIYTGESWTPSMMGPLAAPGVKADEGDYIIAIEGQQLRGSDSIYRALENKVGRQVRLELSKTPDGAESWTEVVSPTSFGDEFGLRNRAWIEGNRRRVEEVSGGRIGYVWVPDTGGGGYSAFNRYYFAQQDRDGMIIDERYNGGGHIADHIVDILAREVRGYFVGRDGPPTMTPNAGVLGPKVMIIDRFAGSGGDMLPFMFRAMKIGPLVGTRTWGGLVGISGYPPLIDGGSITAPSFAFFNADGEWDVENVGVAPDIEVEQWPAEVIAGGDPQLEAAVAECLRLLEENPPVRRERPAPANRTEWKRTQPPLP